MKPMKLNKFFAIILFVALCCCAMLSYGCGANEICFYMGNSENIEECILLELDKQVLITQEKERIVDSELVFNKNADGLFDEMKLCFTGNNIKTVTATSENKTVLYEHYNELSQMVDSINFFYPIGYLWEDKGFDPICDFNTETDFMSRWDSGEFDFVRNVYLNGQNVSQINRTHKDKSKDIGFITASLTDDSEHYGEGVEYLYLDRYEKVNEPVVEVNISVYRANNSHGEKKIPDEPLIQEKSVTTNPNPDSDSFIYRYEKLFYENQQTALNDKGNFDYSDLTGEVINIAVEYLNGSTENYKIKINFDDNGNILALLTL